jgi:hypothetical protein
VRPNAGDVELLRLRLEQLVSLLLGQDIGHLRHACDRTPRTDVVDDRAAVAERDAELAAAADDRHDGPIAEEVQPRRVVHLDVELALAHDPAARIFGCGSGSSDAGE